MPACSASAGRCQRTGSALIFTVPPSGRYTPVKIWIRVDLPAPLAPSRAWTSPTRQVRSTPSRTRLPENDLVIPSASRKGTVVISGRANACSLGPEGGRQVVRPVGAGLVQPDLGRVGGRRDVVPAEQGGPRD